MSWDALWLSLRVTSLATLIMVAVGLPVAFLLARRPFRGRTVVEVGIMVPLVLPPSVTGYYLLRLLGREGPVAAWLRADILFTWQAAVVAAAVVGLPLFVQAARAAIAGVDPALENAARTLGSSEVEVFLRVTLPLARRGLLAGLLLGATRAFGEFGATLMVAGNIPGRTQTLPLAVYDAVLGGQYALANRLVVLMTVLALGSLWAVRRLEEA